MLFKNLYIENATEAMDIRVTDGKFEKIAASLEALPGESAVNLLEFGVVHRRLRCCGRPEVE